MDLCFAVFLLVVTRYFMELLYSADHACVPASVKRTPSFEVFVMQLIFSRLG